ncbi:MAG TPA: glutathione peroxidase [Paracoccaceae bacterium]|nr:glutathione peroxidase [Paracoccaceae bacterium]
MRANFSRRGVRGLLGAALALGPARAGSAHDFRFPALEGVEIRLADFAGRAVLVVNTASLCGFTGQYAGLQALADRYAGGLVVVGVPSDDFHQELGSAGAVREFCDVNFAITFPLTDILPVTGEGAHPFYRWAAEAGGAGAVPRWNFHKLLIGPDGWLAASFPTATAPLDPALGSAIEALLPGWAG